MEDTVMSSAQVKAFSFLFAACGAVALAGISPSAQGEDLNQITVRGSDTRTIGYDFHSLSPIEETTVSFGVSYDPVTLTTNSGVALLKDAVTQAAFKACGGEDLAPDKTCMRIAVDQAQQQIARAVAKARSGVSG
jgi:UrcA family protein